MLSFIALGLVAGFLTTVVGLGGGVLLVLGLSLLAGPRFALAASAPALLGGNLHRLYLFREHLDPKVAGVFLLGALPAAFLGGLVAVGLPEWLIRGALLVAVALMAGRALGWLSWTPPPSALLPAGIAAGGVGATSGTAILIPPVLLASGIRGDAFIATAAATASSIHLARFAGYGVGGLVDGETLLASAVVAAAVVAGNLAGKRVRAKLSEGRKDRLAYGAVLGMSGLAVVGMFA